MLTPYICRLAVAAFGLAVASCTTNDLRPRSAIEFNESSFSQNRIREPDARAKTVPLPDFQSPRETLKYVLSHTPDEPVVYPTERYYYYKFPMGARFISGNIRFADIEKGVISIGYFDAYSEREVVSREFHDGEDGVDLDLDAGTHSVRLTIDGLSRRFSFDQSAFTNPSFPLLDGERFISGIRDESGYYLHLLYWKPERSLYYVINPDIPTPEPLDKVSLGDLNLFFGHESRYCFYEHGPTGRKILVGVHERNIRQNTWFDGPFDQFPPHLNVKSILEEAYPYVTDAGGIDSNGNFVNLPGQRVAISPYIDYAAGPALVEELRRRIEDDPTPRAWIRATYESKRDWRAPSIGDVPPAHQAALSSSWPANHWGTASRLWGDAHAADLSVKWPANHEPGTSTKSEEKK
jgi:hypothetical protein